MKFAIVAFIGILAVVAAKETDSLESINEVASAKLDQVETVVQFLRKRRGADEQTEKPETVDQFLRRRRESETEKPDIHEEKSVNEAEGLERFRRYADPNEATDKPKATTGGCTHGDHERTKAHGSTTGAGTHAHETTTAAA